MADVSNSKLLENNTGALPKGACVVIVRTEWNAAMVDKLEEGCTRILAEQKVKKVKRLEIIYLQIIMWNKLLILRY